MYDDYGYYSAPMSLPIIKPNRITGEGRMKPRAHKDKYPDLKKKQHRKMAKASKRKNRK